MYRRMRLGWTKHLDFMFLDVIAVEIAYFLACMIRSNLDLYLSPSFRAIPLVFVGVEFIVGLFLSSYNNILKRGYVKEAKDTFIHSSEVWIMLTLIFYLLQIAPGFSRTVFVVGWAFDVIFSYVFRVVYKPFVRVRLQRQDNRGLILITDSENAESTIQTVRKNSLYGLHLVGLILIDQDCVGDMYSGVRVVAGKSDAQEYLCRNWVDEVLVNVPEDEEVPEEIIHVCEKMGITVHLRLALVEELKNSNRIVQNIAGYTVVTSSIRFLDNRQALMKRLMDIAGGLVGTFFTLLICIFVGPIIFIKSPGPIFFSQIRIGKNGRKFKIYKFRSMYMDAEERKKELMKQNKVADGMMFKMDNDPRIIKGIGHFIRKTSLDEFPQFFNVLKGDMSLVGTRPPTVDEWEKYEPEHRVRMAIKPGITGMWQVSGRSDITDFEEVVALDEEYIREWSFGLDIRILLKTVFGMFTGKGAS